MSHSPKILIVDDDPFIRDTLQEPLRARGYAIHTASGGKEAIECLNREEFDLVLLDIVMPDIDGFQVMDHVLRQSEDTLVIILTGYGSTESAIEALRRGAYYYLGKPIENEELLKMVKNALDQKRLETERKRAEEAQKKAYDELERRIEERTAELVKANRELKEEITERKRAEEALRKERNFINTLIQNSPTFFVAIDADGKTMMMNEAMLSSLGYSADEIKGTNYLATFVPEKDHKLLSGIFARLVQEMEPTMNQNHVLTKDGRELLVEWHGRPVFKATGEFNYFFGVGIDISERKQAEEALRESEEKYRFLTENIVDIIWILNRGFRTTYVSPSIEKVLGFTPEERKQQTLEEMITPESVQKVKEKFKEELRIDEKDNADPDRPVTIEVEFYHKDGSTVWMENSVKAIRDPTGSIAGCMASPVTSPTANRRKWHFNRVRSAIGL